MKDLLVKLGGLGALLICIPVIWRISQGDIFNPVSFLLWSSLSLVSAIVLLRAKNGGHTLMFAYWLSDLSVGVSAWIKTGKIRFGYFEAFIVVLIMVCVFLWLWCEKRNNLKPSVIANASALMIAGIPQFLDIFRDPSSVSLVICWLYLIISAFSYIGEKPTLNARLIPGLSVIYWIPIMIRMYVH